MPPASRRTEVARFQKGHAQPTYAVARPMSEATDMYDTEFEDLSDAEEYSGRRSEESVSDTRYCHLQRVTESVVSLGSEVTQRSLRSMSCGHQIQTLSMASTFNYNCKAKRIHLSPSKAPVDPISSAYRKIPPKMSTSTFLCLHLFRLRMAMKSALFPRTPISSRMQTTGPPVVSL